MSSVRTRLGHLSGVSTGRKHREPVVLSLVIFVRFEALGPGVVCLEGGWLLFPASAVRHGGSYDDPSVDALQARRNRS